MLRCWRAWNGQEAGRLDLTILSLQLEEKEEAFLALTGTVHGLRKEFEGSNMSVFGVPTGKLRETQDADTLQQTASLMRRVDGVVKF